MLAFKPIEHFQTCPPPYLQFSPYDTSSLPQFIEPHSIDAFYNLTEAGFAHFGSQGGGFAIYGVMTMINTNIYENIADLVRHCSRQTCAPQASSRHP